MQSGINSGLRVEILDRQADGFNAPRSCGRFAGPVVRRPFVF
jgi:hypothetical protein